VKQWWRKYNYRAAATVKSGRRKQRKFVDVGKRLWNLQNHAGAKAQSGEHALCISKTVVSKRGPDQTKKALRLSLYPIGDSVSSGETESMNEDE
jgi:hypothetical protein